MGFVAINPIKLIFVSNSQRKENSSCMNFLRYLFCAIWAVSIFFLSITPLFAAEKILDVEKMEVFQICGWHI